MISISTSLFTTSSLLLLATSSPVAVIEDVTGSSVGVQVMDYVEAGEVIRLGSNDSIVLSYLKSCWHETITGGTVTIGTEQSQVVNGKIEHSRLPCEASRVQFAPALVNQSGAMIFRGEPRLSSQLTIYGLSPIIEVSASGMLVIERIDQPGERKEITFGREELVHNSFLDLAQKGVSLTAGGIYRATVGAREVTFKIDPQARPGQTPIVSRLLRLQTVN